MFADCGSEFVPPVSHNIKIHAYSPVDPIDFSDRLVFALKLTKYHFLAYKQSDRTILPAVDSLLTLKTKFHTFF